MNISKKFTAKERREIINEESLARAKNVGGDTYEQYKTEFEFLKSLDDNEEAVYYIDFTAKGTNSFGATIQTNFSATVINNDEYSIVNLKKKD